MAKEKLKDFPWIKSPQQQERDSVKGLKDSLEKHKDKPVVREWIINRLKSKGVDL